MTSKSSGDSAEFSTLLTTEKLQVTLFTERQVGPSLLIHCRLQFQRHLADFI